MSRVFSTPCVPNLADAIGRSANVRVQFVAINSAAAPAGDFGPGVSVVNWYPFRVKGWKESFLTWFCGYTVFALYLILRSRPSALIAVSIRGLFVGFVLRILTGIPLAYYSLEFYPGSKPVWRRVVRFVERICLKRIDLLVVHDETRLRVYEGIVGRCFPNVAYFPNGPVPAIPNGDDDKRVRERLGIEPDKNYILYAGSLNSQRFSAEEFVSLLDRLGSDWGLVLQSYVGHQGLRCDERFARLRENKQLIVNEVPLSVNEYYALTRIAKIGLATYSTTDDNMKYVALSSGKIGNYWHAGLPIIINRIPFYETVCAQYCSGAVFDSPDEVPDIVKRIHADYASYQAGARYCFSQFFDERRYLGRLGEATRKLISV